MELLQREPDIFGGPVYLSVIEGALDVLRRAGLGYGELNPLSVPVSENVRGDELPDSMVQCGPEVVDGIADDKREFAYDGFVAFSSDGAFSRLIIRFDSVAERAALLEEAVGFSDVLLGPLKLEGVTSCHG